MHELLLFGHVSQSRHEQVLKVLAGLAAMQPRRTIRRVVVYRPQREPEEPGLVAKRGGTQDVAMKHTKQTGPKDLHYTHLVQHLTQADFDSGPARPPDATPPIAGVKPRWTWEFADVPEAGDRGGVLVRLAHTTNITEGDPHAYMVDGGHNYVTEYYTEGHRFVHDNVVITLSRILQEPGTRSIETSPKDVLPSLDALKPLDPSGSYILEAKIRVQDLNNAAVSEAGVKELNGFREQMKGCVELHAPERLALDTRVRYQPKIIQRPVR